MTPRSSRSDEIVCACGFALRLSLAPPALGVHERVEIAAVGAKSARFERGRKLSGA